MKKTFARKIAEHEKWDIPLYALALLLPIIGFGLDYLVPAWRGGEDIGFSVLPPIITLVFGIVIVLQIREAKTVRYWQRMADELTSGASKEIALKSWQNIYSPIFMIFMGVAPFLPSIHHPPHHPLIRLYGPWFSWLFIVGGIWFILVRTRWSPIGIPEIEVTADYIRIPNPAGIWIDGKRENKRSYLTGVLSISLSCVRKVQWGMYGYNEPGLTVKCTGMTIEHPFLNKPPETIADRECIVLANLLAGSVAADAIVAFIEQRIAQGGPE